MSYLIECCDDALLVVKCQFGSGQVSLRHFFCRFLSEEKSRFSLGNRVQVDLEMNSESGWSNCNNVEERGEFYTQKIAIDVGGKHRPMMGVCHSNAVVHWSDANFRLHKPNSSLFMQNIARAVNSGTCFFSVSLRNFRLNTICNFYKSIAIFGCFNVIRLFTVPTTFSIKKKP